MPVVQMLWVALGSALPLVAGASAFQAAMDGSRWTVNSSVYECRLSHRIPHYGEATITQGAGEKPVFRLPVPQAAAGSGQVSLVSSPPVWKPHGSSHSLARVDVRAEVDALALGGGTLTRLLAELLAGQELVFSGPLMPQAGAVVRVVLSPVNFRSAYQQYQRCLATLLPVNFEQIRRTALYFPKGSDELPKRDLAKLDNISRYADADSSVQSFYVDGHTDGGGDRQANLELSQRRAETVVSLLMERGIPLDKITTRWHGERYPVASNQSAEGQAKNRRVTVRLERTAPGQTPSGQPSGIKESVPRQQAGLPQSPLPAMASGRVPEQARMIGDGRSTAWRLQ